jgi:hypothetical protein
MPLQKARHLLGVQHHRQFAWLVHKGQVSNRIGAVERDDLLFGRHG